jgi:hypothetical protein
MKRAVSVFKYISLETSRSVLYFYIVIAAIYFVLFPLLNSSGTVNFVGVDGASIIFLFVMGLNLFKQNFLFSQANGVTRRHFYLGSLMAIAAIAAALTVADAVLNAFVRLIDPSVRNLSVLVWRESSFASGIVWKLCANLASMFFGWFITMVFYRSGKALKLVLSIGVPVLLFVVWPVVDSAMQWHPFLWFANSFVMNFYMKSIWNGTLCLLAIAAAFSGFCYLLVRRAPVKALS